MSAEKLKVWARHKLKQGVPEEKLRESLREEGLDPSIVDEVVSEDSDDLGVDLAPDKKGTGDGSGNEERSNEQDSESPSVSVIDASKDESQDEGSEHFIDIAAKEKRLEQVAGGIESSIRGKWRSWAAFLVLIALLSGAILAAPLIQEKVFQSSKNVETGTGETENPKQPVSVTETVVFTGGVSKPSTVTVPEGGVVKFRNRLGTGVKIDFERFVEDFRLEPGETRTVKVEGLTYYTATSEVGQRIHGSVEVR